MSVKYSVPSGANARSTGFESFAELNARAMGPRRELGAQRAEDPRAVAPLFLPYLGDGERDDPTLRAAFIGLSDRHGRDELAYAAERFDSVEINGSFYSLQRPSSYQRWRDATPPGFVFAVKGGRFITHMLSLRNTRAALLQSPSGLGVSINRSIPGLLRSTSSANPLAATAILESGIASRSAGISGVACTTVPNALACCSRRKFLKLESSLSPERPAPKPRSTAAIAENPVPLMNRLKLKLQLPQLATVN